MRDVLRKSALSIRFQILTVCVLSLVGMQVILMLNYYQFRQMKISENNKYFADLIEQMSESVELNCGYLNGMVENIAYSTTVQNYLGTTDSKYLQNHYKDVKNFIKPFADIKTGIKDIAVIGVHGNIVNLNIDNDTIHEIVQEIPEKTLWHYTGLHEIVINKLSYSLFTVGANVYSTSDFTKKDKIGTVLITFNMKSIFGFAGNQVNSQLPDMLIFDKNRNLVYSSIDEGISSDYTNYSKYFMRNGSERASAIELGSGTYYIKTGTLETLGGKVVVLITKKELMQGLDSARQKTLLVCTAVFALMLFLSLAVTNNIVVPIQQFMVYLQKVGQGDLKLMKRPVKLKGAAELMVMSEEFNRMMGEINDLNHRLLNTSTRLYESELAKKQSELDYMYSQINPHFLFNTLESIKGCAVEENADTTFQMVNSLGKMFRYCVRSGNIVSVEEEINVINSYMYLQKLRFGSKLNYIFQVSEDIYSASIPKMILQPIIENAITHGIEENGAVTVRFTGKREEDTLFFCVRNDGRGIDEQKRKELIENMNNKFVTAHIGLSNVNNRLKYIYGEAYGVEIEDTHGEGFCVILKFPYNKQQKEGGYAL